MAATSISLKPFRMAHHNRGLIVLLVIFLPVAVAVALSARSVQLDTLRIEAVELERAAEQRVALNRQLDTGLRALALESWLAAAETLPYPDLYPITLRGMVISGHPQLVVVYERGERTYPPRDSIAATPGEVHLFNRLSSQIQELVAHADKRGESLRWLYFDGGRGLLMCKKPSIGDVVGCVLIGQARLDRLLKSILADFEVTKPGWGMQLRDATGQQLEDALPPFSKVMTEAAQAQQETALRGLMTGWQLIQTVPKTPTGSDGALATLGAPGVLFGACFCSFWLLLIWYIHQRRVAELKGSEERVALATYLSHDLRNPLANVRLYADLLLRECRANKKASSYANIIGQELTRLEGITNNALALANNGLPASSNLTFDPDTAIRQLLTLRTAQFADAKVDVEFAPAADRFSIAPPVFERVLGNLLDNACKYAPGGSLQISTQIIDGDLQLIVRDHGPGLAGNPNDAAGPGLGLKSARSLMTENGGKFRLENAQPGLRAIARFRPEPTV